MRKRKQYDDDDGKVIAKMNVEGMPWYVDRGAAQTQEPEGEPVELNWKEKLAFLWGTLSASLLVALIFGLAFLTVILLILFFGSLR